MENAVYAVALLFAYLAGSIPTGYLVGRSRGVDIRAAGSGNIGATNAFRILGKKAGTFVLATDILKGFLACWFAPKLAVALCPAVAPHEANLALAAGLTAVLGHNYTCWLRFKGGKGISTTAGVLIALSPVAAAVAIGGFLLMLLITRYVSVGSITAALLLPFAAWFSGSGLAVTVVFSILAVLALFKHRANIVRLANGTEHRVGSKKKEDGQ